MSASTVYIRLTEQDVAHLEDFAGKPGRSIDECLQWVRDRGYKISRSAMGRWIRQYRAGAAGRRNMVQVYPVGELSMLVVVPPRRVSAAKASSIIRRAFER